MIPRVAARGHSFKGAGLYYLHDKQSKTSERVAWTETRNLPTHDAQKGMNWMAHTSMNAEELKRIQGVKSTGRKASSGPVYSYSLAWQPEQSPDRDRMVSAVDETLALLNLKDHEAVIVAHNETEHPHVHVICNLVHPDTGKIASTSYDQLKLSRWAESLEQQDGKIYCEQRVINNAKRREIAAQDKEQKIVKHKEEKHQLSQLIQNLYIQSDSGRAFQAALKHQGIELAQGDRRGFVLVDEQGKIHSLSRQLKGQRAKDIKQRLSDIEQLALAKDIAHQKKHFDRDQYETDRQKAIVDAAIHRDNRVKKEQQTKAKQCIQAPSKSSVSAEFLKQLDEKRQEELKIQQQKDLLEKEQEKIYQKNQVIQRLRQIHESRQKVRSVSKVFNKSQHGSEEEALKKSLQNIEGRIREQNEALDRTNQGQKDCKNEQSWKDRLRSRNLHRGRSR